MELSAHDVVVVASKHTNASPGLPVPDSNCLIVRGTKHPRIFVVKSSCSHIIQVTKQREDTSLLFIVPDFNLEIISTGNEQRLLIVKCYSSHRAIVLIKLLQQIAYSVVPQLDDTGVQTKTKQCKFTQSIFCC